MKVALLTNFLPPYRIAFLEALEREVGELTVLVSADMESNRDWVFDAGQLEVMRQRTATLPGRWNGGTRFTERREVHVPLDTIATLRRLQPDVVVSAELGARTLLASRFATRSGTPLVCWATLSEATEQGLDPVRLRLRRFLARHVDHWIVNGASGRREIARYGANPSRSTIVPYSTTSEHDTPASPTVRGDRVLRLLYVGQLTDRKGLLPFLHALTAGSPGDWARIAVTVIGRGPLLGEIQRAGGTEVEVLVKGPLTHQATLEAYGAHDALILPTLADEWAVVVNEALSSGLAVFGSSKSQAVAEMVRHGQEGLVFDPTPAGLALIVEQIVGLTPTALNDMRRAAAVRAQAFAIERVAPVMANAIRSVVVR